MPDVPIAPPNNLLISDCGPSGPHIALVTLVGLFAVVATLFVACRGKPSMVFYATVLGIFTPGLVGSWAFVAGMQEQCRILGSTAGGPKAEEVIYCLAWCLDSLNTGLFFSAICLVIAFVVFAVRSMRAPHPGA